jgi:hypothetical protein
MEDLFLITTLGYLSFNTLSPCGVIVLCNCNLFAVHKSKLGYNPVDIDIVTYTYMLSNIVYIVSE